MSRTPLLALIAAALLCAAPPAGAQQAQPDFPDGPGKQTFVNLCGACHDINRVRIGYTAEGWQTVIRMMLNFDVPIPPNEVDTLTQYLVKNFPERSRPAAVVIPGPVDAAIKLLASADAGIAAARSARHTRRRHLVHRATLRQARPSRSQDRTVQGISGQDAADRSARPRRGQGRQYLVHREPPEPDRQA